MLFKCYHDLLWGLKCGTTAVWKIIQQNYCKIIFHTIKLNHAACFLLWTNCRPYLVLMYQRNGSAWALVMVCHLSRNKPLPVELQLTCQLHLENKLQRNSNLTREFSFKKIGLKIESVLPKGPTRHAYAWPIGSFWQDTFDLMTSGKCRFCSDIGVLCQSVAVATPVHGNEYTIMLVVKSIFSH